MGETSIASFARINYNPVYPYKTYLTDDIGKANI